MNLKLKKLNWHTALERFAPVIPILMLLGACGAASLVLSSCDDNKTSFRSSQKHQPLTFEGVPVIRVRLTTRPISKAMLSTTSSYNISVDGQLIAHHDKMMPKTLCRRNGGKWIIGDVKAKGKKLTITPTSSGGGAVEFGKQVYRGELVLLAASGESFYVHNNVNFESYIAGVLPRELYPHFHPEAYRAQAVAARSYAMYEMVTRGRKNSFDVWATQKSQVYKGSRSETDKAWNAVRKTHGWVLAYGADGQERIFLSQFSACNGGYVNGASVIRGGPDADWPPLKGGQYDGTGKKCPVYSWKPVRLSKADIYKVLARNRSRIRKLGGIKTLRIKSQTSYGRPIYLEVVSPAGKTASLRAEDLRLCMLRSDVKAAKKLYSMNCKIRDVGDAIEFYDGTGYGHGVGMSQWGAEDRANRGESAEDILEFYYPTAKILRAY